MRNKVRLLQVPTTARDLASGYRHAVFVGKVSARMIERNCENLRIHLMTESKSFFIFLDASCSQSESKRKMLNGHIRARSFC